MAHYARIIVDISHEKLDRTFEYEIPPHMAEDIKPGVQVRIPFGNSNRLITGYVLEVVDQPEYDPAKIKAIDSLVSGAVAIESQLIQLAAWMRRNYGGTMNQALKTVIPVKEKTRQKEKRTVRLLLDPDQTQQALDLFESKSHKARARLMAALSAEGEIPYEFVTQKLNISGPTIKALAERGMIAVETQTSFRNPVGDRGPTDYHLTLNEGQQQVVDGVLADIRKGLHKTYLLHGITGSGKTEVYMELIAYGVSQGKSAIVLIPEIALTYQTVMRFYKRFGQRVSILNSRMSKGERYDQYLRAKKGELDVIIGPRSALFTPFSNLGFIIIDEEHEETYRSENVPRYHAREVAIERARMTGASVILGSATPSVESYYRAKEGQYDLYELTARAASDHMAQVEVVDLKQELASGNKSVLSRRLQQEMKLRLDRGEQTMLFLNRRGVSGLLSCRSCGHVIKCPHCDISLSSHNDGNMVCHYCGYQRPLINICPHCGSRAIGGFKAGTQKMEEIVQRTFPKARILRMDFDTTREKDGHEKILSAFANQEADILIGTQMIVKGHDFPNVTLVGALAADLSLYVSDYGAAERTFQLLTQAVGRAGRGSKPGLAIIQTYNPDHYAIMDSARQDYKAFYQEEITYRQMLRYPPVWNMMAIHMSSPDYRLVEAGANALSSFIRQLIKDYNIPMTALIGPADPNVAKVNDIYKKLIYMKNSDYVNLIKIKDRVEAFVNEDPGFSRVNVQFDFN